MEISDCLVVIFYFIVLQSDDNCNTVYVLEYKPVMCPSKSILTLTQN